MTEPSLVTTCGQRFDVKFMVPEGRYAAITRERAEVPCQREPGHPGVHDNKWLIWRWPS